MTRSELYNAIFPTFNENIGSIWFTVQGGVKVQQWGIYFQDTNTRIVDYVFYQVIVRPDKYIDLLNDVEEAKADYEDACRKAKQEIEERIIQRFGSLDNLIVVEPLSEGEKRVVH